MQKFIDKVEELQLEGLKHLKKLKEGKYKEHTGWLDVPASTDELNQIKKIAHQIRQNSDVLVVVGVGGSYLGARAVIEALTNKYDEEIEIMYLGNSTSALDLKESLEYLKTKDFSVNVISKSGTTLEPALAFSFVKKALFRKYGKEEGLKRMVITTDEEKGLLREYATKNGVKTFTVPDDVGGRFSVLTPVGLLPIATAGVDIDSLIKGAKLGRDLYGSESKDSMAIEYAAMRNTLHMTGIDIEILVSYEPRMKYFTEWWKQLFGESEGKDGKGIFPANAVFTTDLHSIGQLIQDGKRNLFETHISFKKTKHDLTIFPEEEDEESLGHLEFKTVNYVNEQAMKATIDAHIDGDVPVVEVDMEELDAANIGQLIYFFMLSCSISGLILGVNPFDQPGVEDYKENMRRLLSR